MPAKNQKSDVQNFSTDMKNLFFPKIVCGENQDQVLMSSTQGYIKGKKKDVQYITTIARFANKYDGLLDTVSEALEKEEELRMVATVAVSKTISEEDDKYGTQIKHFGRITNIVSLTGDGEEYDLSDFEAGNEDEDDDADE